MTEPLDKLKTKNHKTSMPASKITPAHPSKENLQAYLGGKLATTALDNLAGYREWAWGKKTQQTIWDNGLLSDNRHRLKEALGNATATVPHEGKTLKSYWVKFENHTFIIFTGATRGTSMELVLPNPDAEPDKKTEATCARFGQALCELLGPDPKRVAAREEVERKRRIDEAAQSGMEI